MLKLYSRINNEIHYWETWDKDAKTGVVHWGILGEEGENKEVKSGLLSSFRKQVQKEIDRKLSDGFKQIDIEEHITLLIEFKVEGMGTEQDLEKRTRLQNKIDNLLGWTGLGYCDGGSMGSETMEVCCLVVDFEIAKKVIEKNLKGTEFENYTKIFDEENA